MTAGRVLPRLVGLTVVLVVACALAGCRITEEAIREPGRVPERIVSLSPATTEILFGLGVFSRVVGVSDYCIYPPGVERLPRLGSWQDARLEALARLEPDLVVTGGIESDPTAGHLRALGIPTASSPARSIADVYESILTLGSATGEVAAARDLVERTGRALDDIRNRVEGRRRPRVLLVVDRLPGTLRNIYAPTSGSFLAELLEIAGAEPIEIDGGTAGYAPLAMEALVHLDPDVIIETIQGVPGRFTEDSMAVWGQMPDLEAVRTRRIHPIRDPSILHPSQRIAETARRLAGILHPEVESERAR
jgi:iron complex transport system substrate-binding protein